MSSGNTKEKKLARARQAETGEAYTTALAYVPAKDEPEAPRTFMANVLRRRGRSTKREPLTLELLESAEDTAEFSAWMQGGLPYGLRLVRRRPYWVYELTQARHTSENVLKLISEFNATDLTLVLSGAGGQGER